MGNVSSDLKKQIEDYRINELGYKKRSSSTENSKAKNNTRKSYFDSLSNLKKTNSAEKRYTLRHLSDKGLLFVNSMSEHADTSLDFNSLNLSLCSSPKTPREIDLDEKRKRSDFDPKSENEIAAFNVADDDLSTCESKSMLLPNSTVTSIVKATSDELASQSEEIIDKMFDFKLILQGETIRKSYISKLLMKNELSLCEKPKTYNSMIIFDWDDTLFPTSYFSPKGFFEDRNLTPDEEKIFKELEQTLLNLIKMATSRGETFIVTNAPKSWIYYSAKKFYTDKAERILENVKIVSARDYEGEFPGDTNKWKINSFIDIAKEKSKKLLTNIISIGDSLIEITAANKLGETFNNVFVKTIKLKDNPKAEELLQQMTLINKQFEMIYCSQKNMNIKLGKRS